MRKRSGLLTQSEQIKYKKIIRDALEKSVLKFAEIRKLFKYVGASSNNECLLLRAIARGCLG